MIAAAVIRSGIARREREEIAARQRREAESRRQDHQSRAEEDRRLQVHAQLRAQLMEERKASQRTAASAAETTIFTDDSSDLQSARKQKFSQDELIEARRRLAALDIGGAGVLHFSDRPHTALSGIIAPGDDALSLRVTFWERPSDLSDPECLRLALRCLAVQSSQASVIERACASATPPPDFMCPITLSVMRDPVTASDGCTYERSAIAEWLTRRRSSPLTNCAIASASLAPDDALRRRIDQWARGAVDRSLAASARPSPSPSPPPSGWRASAGHR